MKIYLFSAVAFIALITFFSCKKSNSSSSAPTVTTSQWMYNNITYKADTSFFVNNGEGYTLESDIDDTAGNVAEIIFPVQPKSSANFSVVGPTASPTDTQCQIAFGNNNDTYISKGGGTVAITIANGKITAVFSNIASYNGVTSTTISGTLIAVDN